MLNWRQSRTCHFWRKSDTHLCPSLLLLHPARARTRSVPVFAPPHPRRHRRRRAPPSRHSHSMPLYLVRARARSRGRRRLRGGDGGVAVADGGAELVRVRRGCRASRPNPRPSRPRTSRFRQRTRRRVLACDRCSRLDGAKSGRSQHEVEDWRGRRKRSALLDFFRPSPSLSIVLSDQVTPLAPGSALPRRRSVGRGLEGPA